MPRIEVFYCSSSSQESKVPLSEHRAYRAYIERSLSSVLKSTSLWTALTPYVLEYRSSIHGIVDSPTSGF